LSTTKYSDIYLKILVVLSKMFSMMSLSLYQLLVFTLKDYWTRS